MLAYGAMLTRVAEQARQFDVLHAHLDWIHIPLLRCLGVPFVTTLHGRLDHPALAALSRSCFPDARFVSISNAQRIPLPDANWVDTVYHGLPGNLLTPNHHPRGYLAFLGRFTPDKGPETAIHLARAAGMPLKIAAKIVRAERHYFTQRIKPLLDGNDVEFVGEIDEAHKAEFLGNASALLFPICWPEPFGLVMIEAMACGTPVVAFRCGSVPEVVDEGVTGFVVEPQAGLSAIDRAAKLDRRRIRNRFEQRFTARRMAEDYVRVYENVIAGAKGGPVDTPELRMSAG
jgi:glycosyltransferase involved in cell wall biosynthesis